ncbi:MAG: permease [Betaproteobacteria bacterium RIFCSPLOWO2_12_FULL_65_14]|nr:MAG: permease [Betaproteobacteria bacterium RIFCSPLOWO2_12_FULL_65_14]
MKAPRRSAAVALMVAAPVLWSSAGVVTRHLERAPAFEQVFWRSLFACAFVALTLSVLQRRTPFKALHAAGWPGLFSGAMWAVMFTAFVLALSLTTTANTLVTMSISPLLTVLLARMLLKDPVPARTWVAAGAAAAGIAWMFSEGLSASDSRHVGGMLVAFLVPMAAAANVIVLRASAARVDLIPAVMLGGALSCLIALPLAWPFSASARDIVLLALLGVFQLGLPCMLLVLASRALLAPELALLGLLEVVLGPLWAWLGAGEVPGRATLIGGAVVLAALAGNELAAFRGIMRDKLSVTRISG